MEREFFNLIMNNGNLCVEVGYNSIASWCLVVTQRNGGGIASAEEVVSLQECDIDLLFAKAYIELTTYLSETRNGY